MSNIFCMDPVSSREREKRSLMSDWGHQFWSLLQTASILNGVPNITIDTQSSFKRRNLDLDFETRETNRKFGQSLRRSEYVPATEYHTSEYVPVTEYHSSDSSASHSGYGDPYHSDHSTGSYGHSGGGYSVGSYSGSGYGPECCPLVVDPLLLTALLGFIAGATFFFRSKMSNGSRTTRFSLIFTNFHSFNYYEHCWKETQEFVTAFIVLEKLRNSDAHG